MTVKNGKLRHARVSQRAISELQPSPENDRLYRPIDPADPDIQALANSIREHGIREPLVVSLDGYILSGHRRFAAARQARLLTVPVRVEPIRRIDDPHGFVVLLREYNRQREKSLDEKLREEIVSLDPAQAYAALLEHRRREAELDTTPLMLGDRRQRCRISKAKQPFLDAILNVLEERKSFLPLSDRAIHYALLNAPPLKHAAKPKSIYDNTRQSYNALTELLTRARIAGEIPMHAICDETRPVTLWKVFREPAAYLRNELGQFLKGYWRDLLQSQPNHIELVCEKNTVEPIVRKVAMEYGLPLTSGRGYCSLPPRAAMATRFRQSGKQQLVLLMLSDFDPDGEEIVHSFARSMRDDFGIQRIHPLKVALTEEQVTKHALPAQMVAKTSSVHHAKFIAQHGENVFELEALAPECLQEIVREAVDSVLDTEAFNAEMDAEKADAGFLTGLRTTVCKMLEQVGIE